MENKLQEYISKTGDRSPSFALMLNALSKKPNKLIVETGCARKEDNFHGDGMSTLIFDEFINVTGGNFFSVDISPENVEFAKSKVSPHSQVICSDSVKFLYDNCRVWKGEGRFIDLLYLDSFDLDKDNTHPSSLHHILELTAAMPCLRSGSIICVDDNISKDIGKGSYVRQFMDLIGRPLVYEGYHWIWIL
jgi:predicted O-methyltransferase YrrM